MQIMHLQKIRDSQHVFSRQEGTVAGGGIVAAPSVEDAGGMLTQASDTHVQDTSLETLIRPARLVSSVLTQNFPARRGEGTERIAHDIDFGRRWFPKKTP